MPAGYVFSIWGLIYVGLVAFVVFQLLPAQRENPRLRRVGYLFAATCAANVAWIFLWHYERFPLSLVAMATLLVLLIAIYLRVGVGRVAVPAVERWCVQAPFSLYLGWITVATIANVTTVLDFVGWGGWGVPPEAWAVVMLVVATAIALAVVLTRRDVLYALVIVWAFAGIAVKHAAVPTVAVAAWATTALVAVVAVARLALGLSRRQAPVGR